jgi:IS30 family transposase
MVRYRRLTLMEREEISRLLAVGHSLRATAYVLGRAPSTLVRELARHRMSSLTYRAVTAAAPARFASRRAPFRTSSASTNGPPRSPIGPCRVIGRGTCSWAMPMPRPWER